MIYDYKLLHLIFIWKNGIKIYWENTTRLKHFNVEHLNKSHLLFNITYALCSTLNCFLPFGLKYMIYCKHTHIYTDTYGNDSS